MIERDMRQKLVELLKPLGAFAVENGGCTPGTPDVACTRGWIECKATERWPAREDTVVKLDHELSQTQRIWILKWSRRGGRAWVMLNIAGEWLLFDGMEAREHLGRATRQQLYRIARSTWNRTPTTEELLACLK